MSTGMIITIIVAVIAVAVGISVVAGALMQKKRSDSLREEFGPEYDRVLKQHGSHGRAESELRARRERVEALRIKPLAPADRERFAEEWRSVQVQFVDDPGGAVTGADHLVAAVMQMRGYPVGDFEQRIADISVDHPRVVENYRSAHRIAQAQERGEAGTEDQRQAMIHYHGLFDDLLGQPQASRAS